MAEEAQGQAVAQPADESLNQFQAQSLIAASLEVQESETPRDEKGKFAKAKPAEAEAKPEEEAEAKPEEAEAAPEEEQPEIKPEPRRFKLKYKGEELEKDENEVISLAQQGYDYTQKSQALAKERDELPVKLKAEVDAKTKQYEDQLETFKQAVIRLADPEAISADLNKLSLEDPARAQQLFFKRMQIQQTLQGIHVEQQRIAQTKSQEVEAAKQKQLQEAVEAVQREVPGWGQELYGKILKTATSNGYTQQEANAITDHRHIKVLDKARQWDEYVAAKPKTVDKRVAAVPKVQKPGSAEKPNPKAESMKAGMERLEKTGRRDDAVDLVTQLLKDGRL